MVDEFWAGFAKQANSMTEIGGGLGHAFSALKNVSKSGLGKATAAAGDAAAKVKGAASAGFERAVAQPSAVRAAEAAKASEAAQAAKAKSRWGLGTTAKPQQQAGAKPGSGPFQKARTYGRGMVAGGALTAAGFGLASMHRHMNQGAMEPLPPGYR